MKVLVTSSFMPSSEQDKLPQFLLDQALAFARNYPDDEFVYLAASRAHKPGKETSLPDNLSIHRFSYFWPRQYQVLTEFGIMSSIKKYPLSAMTLPFMFLFEYLALNKLIKKVRPDVVYSHWMLPQGILADRLCRKHGIRHVLTSHSSDIEVMFRYGQWLQRRARSALQRLAAMNVVSSRGRDFLSQVLPEEEYQRLAAKLQVIPMGVPLSLPEKVAELRTSQVSGGRTELLFMGRLAEKKGIFYLLEALQIVHNSQPDIHLTLAGEGLIQDEVADYIKYNDLSEIVTMTGFVGGAEKASCLAKADLFILPSITTDSGDREGLPVTLIENMSCGNLCIATRGSGAEELIEDNVSGRLINPKDADAIATAILTTLAMPTEEQQSMSQAARQHSQHLRWDELIKQYYQQLLA